MFPITNNYKLKSKRGFTFIETLVGVAVFVFVTAGIYNAYSLLIKSAKLSRLKVAATMIGNEQIEIIRNLPFSSVGTVGGIPSGVIQSDSVINRDGVSFHVKTVIRSKDDPFDGTINGSPNDTSPADYKMVDVSVSCPNCGQFSYINLTTNVSPKNLETTSTNGALFINVFDALGKVVPGANVNVVNSFVSPQISLSDVTGSGGALQLVDVPPSSQKYAIKISRDGYSSDRTYPISVSNPHPTKPDATVAQKTATQISFSIDKTSSLNISSVTATCTTTPNIGFILSGAKLIGTVPSVLKYSSYNVTNSSAMKLIEGLEWDTYSVSVPVTSTSTHFLAGTLPMFPINILPDSNTDFKIILRPKNPNGLLISVKDVSSKLPISGANIEITKSGVTSSMTTGRGSQSQINWSSGPGQIDFYDSSKYYYSEGVDYLTGIRLAKSLSLYESNGYLESSTFDTGSASNFYNISWSPIDQPVGVGVDSVKFQIATNNDGTSFNFLGHDGTSGTYYTSSGSTINSIHSGDRYLRYKVYLHTNNQTFTPNISGISFSYTSSCVPSGQVFFDGLSSGTYQVRVSKSGYASILNDSVVVSSPWQEKVINMSPL